MGRTLFLDDNSLTFDPNSELMAGETIADDQGFSLTPLDCGSPDIFIIAGFSAEEDKLEGILDNINSVKEKYGLKSWLPVKWNLRDTGLTRFYKEYNASFLLEKAMKNVDDMRYKLLDVLEAYDCEVVCSGVRRIAEPAERNKIFRMALTNILQREGIHHKNNVESAFPRLKIVSDWPENSMEKDNVLFQNFFLGYHFGKDENDQKYHSGPLSNIGVYPELYCGKTLFSPYLQLADIVVGALNAFFLWCFRDEKLQIVQSTFPKIKKIFRKNPIDDSFLRWGLTVTPKDFEEKLIKRLEVLETKHLTPIAEC